MHGYHHLGLAALSLLVSILASYTALDLSGRVSSTRGVARRLWLLGGSIAMGVGIWSMHFIGMLSFQLPVPIRYNLRLWLLSVVIAVVASLLALVVVTGQRANLRRLLTAAPLMGFAIAGMHYTGMAAMRVPADIRYDAWLVTLSVGIAIGASFAALWLAHHFRSLSGPRATLGKGASAIIMGLAICGMHYTAMAGVRFEPLTRVVRDSGANLVATRGLTVAVLLTTLLILGLALLGITIDRRVESRLEASAATADAAIGERIEVQARLRESEESYHSLFNSLTELVYVIDPEGHFLDVNRAVEHAFGYSRDEIVGQPPGLLTDASRVSLAETRLRLQRAHAGEAQTFESWGRRKNGESFPLEVVLTPATYFGAPAVLAAARDSSARKRADADRAVAEARYRRLAEASPYGIFICDGGGRLIELNPAAENIFMAAKGKLETFGTLLEPGERSRFADDLSKVMLTSLPVETEVSIRLESGEARLVALTLTHVQEGDSQPLVHGMARDITIERERDRQLGRAERLAGVGTLVGGVAHELNNPLTSIKNFAEIMLLDEHPPEDREALEIMGHEADRAARIVSELRLLARATQDDIDKARELVDLNAVVAHVVRLRRYHFETNNIDIHEDLTPTAAQILGDRGQLDQVVLNLIVNAAHALESGESPRRICIRTREELGRVILEISDTGTGIDATEIDRIFDPFWTTKAPGEGTGLGLSLVQRIVTDHGGWIGVQSERGKGTTFRLEFPNAPAISVASSPESRSPLAKRTFRLLIVDDEAGIRLSVQRYLVRRGHHVDTAAEGAEALRLIDRASNELPYDVILSDLRMPGLGGDQLLEELRARKTGLDRRIVFMSGDAANPRATRLFEASAGPVVYKPFSLVDLAEVLEEFAEMVQGGGLPPSLKARKVGSAPPADATPYDAVGTSRRRGR